MPAASAPDGARELRLRRLTALLLAALVAGVYAPGLDNDFSGDDLEWARFAMSVREAPARIFSLFSGFVTPAMNATVGLDAALAGTAPWIYNLTGLAFHLANVLMIRRLLARATGSRAAAWWAAAAWGLDYRHDEAVFWLGGRPHVLVMTGILLALLLLGRRLRSDGGAGLLAGILAAGAFAILAKESGVMVAPIAALWLLLIEGSRARTARAWAPVAGLFALAAAHGVVLLLVREEHQFYYRLDASWIGRLGALLLQPAGLGVPDTPPWWLLLPAAAALALIAAIGGAAARFGVAAMILGTLPTVLIEFQPPRYRYFPLAGAAFVLAAALRPLMARRRKVAVALMAVVCAFFAAGVRNDEEYLDISGDLHRSLGEAACDAAAGHDRALPFVMVWTPSLRGVEALAAAANRDVLVEVRNYPPIYVRAEGLEGVAEAGTLYALCDGGRWATRTVRLEGAAAAAAIEGPFGGTEYAGGRFLPMGETMREALRSLARETGSLPGVLPDGRRCAVLALRD